MGARKEETVSEANRAYFRSLANSRGAVTRLPKLSALVAVLAIVADVSAFRPGGLSSNPGYEALSYLATVNLVLVGICAAFIAGSCFKQFVLRFQIFFSYAFAAMAMMLVCVLCQMGLAIATLPVARGEQAYAMLFNFVGLGALLLIAAATTAHVILLRRRLAAGHSEKRTAGNYLAISRSSKSKTFWITLGAIAVVPNVLTHGQYLINVLGMLLLILFASVTTSLPVEFGYLAYLKSKDRDYWEQRHERRSRRDGRISAQ